MNFTSYLMSNVKFALKMGAGAIVFSLLIISSSIDLEFGMFWSIVGFVLASIYNLPEYLRYKKREFSYKRNQRKAEKLEKQRLNEIRRKTELYLYELNQMIQEVEFMSDGDKLYSFDLNEKVIYRTNDDAVVLLQKWKSDLEQIMANHWDKEINQFYENTIRTFRQNIHHSNLNTESIYEFFRTLNIPDMYKQILRDPNVLTTELNKAEVINKELNQDFKRLQRGVLGEQVVEKELLKYQGDYMTLFGNRIDMGEDGTVENDVLIFSENGIFTLEVKNIKSTGS
ncbi:nuclease-related domain-containing protein [Exiguobacterium sp. NG55]|uniref:nuclease-related domain-containing protein n=1 Tax=Exiguobacterium sp. NG55 TaxID=375477 RepID=UPI0004DFBF68|nr:nuclease-related domain-containing protein [Exiguobacterium sp. NG55]